MAKQRVQERVAFVTCPNCKQPIEVRNPGRIREDFGVTCQSCGRRSIFHVDDMR